MSQVRGRPFQKGNKLGKGRPAGSRNKSTIALQEIFDQNGEALVKKTQLMALQGDMTAMRLCIERLVPPRRQSRVKFKLPKIATAGDVVLALEHVERAIATGRLPPAEGVAIAGILETHRRAIETTDMETRIRALEKEREKEPSK